MKSIAILVMLALTLSACAKSDESPKKNLHKPTTPELPGEPEVVKRTKIVLKLDDFPAYNSEVAASKAVLDFLCENQVRASLGVIADRLRTNPASKDFLLPYIAKKSSDGKPLFEIWHHGLYHKDFAGAPYEDQKQRFNSANDIVLRELGVQMHSFGAPGNKSDGVTVQVIAENSNYKCLMFVTASSPNENALTKLNNRVNMENGTGIPEYDYFVRNYNNAIQQSLPYMVLQAHPNMYSTPEKIDNFKRIIKFLIEKSVDFVTPYDLAN